jgi:sigma-B regulation protein RsbU (phosphoserine phosphatase)
MVIADVSGKGVPAALFMMASKIILQSVAMLGKSPGEVLSKTNEAICSNNEAEMFVTVWFGILELSSGRLKAANAGHEYPVLKRPDGTFEKLKDKHGFVLGAIDGARYKEYEIMLEKGTKLFQYTDGIPEAANTDDEMFGMERMIEALNESPDATPEELLVNVREAVREFVGDAQQFDDMTMLCVEYKGK